jgi:hypothetical protein
MLLKERSQLALMLAIDKQFVRVLVQFNNESCCTALVLVSRTSCHWGVAFATLDNINKKVVVKIMIIFIFTFFLQIMIVDSFSQENFELLTHLLCRSIIIIIEIDKLS